MPSKTPILSQEAARRLIGDRSFSAGGDRGPVGSPLGAHAGGEVEWLTVSTHNAESHIPLRDTRGAIAAAGTLPGGCRVTFEPGGQLELSSPADLPSAACQAVAEDVAHLRRHLSDYGITLAGMGRDPLRLERRVLQSPRYVAMEQYFDAFGSLGREMMCGTASIQANIDLGSGHEVEARWRQAQRIGPTLAAAFANSPFQGGGPSGWRSTRLAVWQALDATRTSPVGMWPPGRGAWAAYAFNARVMLIRVGEDRFEPITDGLTFGEWMFLGHELGYPDAGDLEYHLSTLFPPVRPRGWLELRMIDSLPDPWWRVAAAVATALLEDSDAGAAALEAVSAPPGGAGVPAHCRSAAPHGLADPALP